MNKQELIKAHPELIKEIAGDIFDRRENHFAKGYFNLAFKEYIAEALREPILVTEDGVEIFDPNKIIYSIERCSWGKIEHRASRNNCHWQDFVKFSNTEARQSYIAQNKPLTSVKEQVEAIEKLFPRGENNKGIIPPIEEVLTNLAKSKM